MSLKLSYLCLKSVRNVNVLVQNRGFKRWLMPTLSVLKKKKEQMEPQPPLHRSALAEWNFQAELYAFNSRLGEDIDSTMLQQAFTTRDYIISEIEKQRSVGIEQPEIELLDNKTMVEKGDAIIDKYVLRYLRTVFPKLPEEGIYSLKQFLSSDDVLAHIASNIGMDDLILTPEIPPEKVTLANAFKAVVASLAESSGLDRANVFVRDLVVTQLVGKNVNALWEIKNPLGLLTEILERDGKPPFEPRLIGEAGRNTILAAFQVGLYVNKELIGAGFGESIQIAKEMAAHDALQRFFNTTEDARPIPFNLELKSDSSEPFANLSIQDWCEKNIKNLNIG